MSSLYQAYKQPTFKRLDLEIPNCFTEFQIEQFKNLECFSIDKFEKHFPEDLEYREFTLSWFLTCIGASDKIEGFPKVGSNQNTSIKVVEKIDQAIKDLTKAISSLDELPQGFDNLSYIDTNTGDRTRVHREYLKGYNEELKLWKLRLSNKGKNELLLDRIFALFDKVKYEIPEIDNIINTASINEIVMIFTGLDDLESVRKMVNRYKDKLTQK